MSLVWPARGRRKEKFQAIAFHSDDWGYCGCVPDRTAYDTLARLFEKRYGRARMVLAQSTLETPQDLERLFEVLEGQCDLHGRHPVFQSAYIVSNPDYPAIQASGGTRFFDVALPQVPQGWERGDIVAKAREGIRRGVWLPVFHGACHFHPGRWMSRLTAGSDELQALANGCFLSTGSPDDFEFARCRGNREDRERLKQGLERFATLFGPPEIAVLPCYAWEQGLERALSRGGIRYLQGKNHQLCRRTLLDQVRGKLFNLVGMKDNAKSWQIETGDYAVGLGISYVCRNVYFEPYQQPDTDIEDVVAQTVGRIAQVWESGQPAVVISHRANYASIDHKVVDRGAGGLHLLFQQLKRLYPEVQFLNDPELVAEMGGRGDGAR